LEALKKYSDLGTGPGNSEDGTGPRVKTESGCLLKNGGRNGVLPPNFGARDGKMLCFCCSNKIYLSETYIKLSRAPNHFSYEGIFSTL